MKKKIFIFIPLLFLVLACGEYTKVYKSANYEKKFLYADRAFKNEKYDNAISLYEQYYQRFPKTDKGEFAYYRLGRSYYEAENYYMGEYYFNQYVTRFPASENAPKAMFYGAMCSVKQSPKASLDQGQTRIALQALQSFAERYPKSDLVDSCNRIMDRLHLKLEKKRFQAVHLYHRTENYRAAVNSAKTFINDFPRSDYLEQTAHILFVDAYHLGMNSVFSKKKNRIRNALDIYLKYAHFFKTKRYAKKMSRYYDDLQQALDKVDERNSYNAIVSAYNNTNTSSENKKVHYLKLTIRNFHTFADRFSTSDRMDKAEKIKEKAEKELQKIKEN